MLNTLLKQLSTNVTQMKEKVQLLGTISSCGLIWKVFIYLNSTVFERPTQNVLQHLCSWWRKHVSQLTARLTNVFLIVVGQHWSSVAWGDRTHRQYSLLGSIHRWSEVFSQALLTLRKKTLNIGGLQTHKHHLCFSLCTSSQCVFIMCVCRWVSNHMNKYGHGDSPGFVDCADV